MSAMRVLASEAIVTVRRGLREARRVRDHGAEPPPVADADDAELDALRGALVHELDRLASADGESSASFRRA